MATPPEFVAEQETEWSSTTNPKEAAALAAQVNDVLIAMGLAEEHQATALAISGTTYTWTTQKRTELGEYTEVVGATTTATEEGSAKPIFTRGASAFEFGGDVLQFRKSAGIGESAKTNVASGTPSLAITTQADNSAIVVAIGDWTASEGARTWLALNGVTPTAGNGYERAYDVVSTRYGIYVAYYPDAGIAGEKTVGLTAPTGLKYSMVAIEIKGEGESEVPQELKPDEDLVTTGWTETPLYSKLNDGSTSTKVKATLS